jgi:hypothetical protein
MAAKGMVSRSASGSGDQSKSTYCLSQLRVSFIFKNYFRENGLISPINIRVFSDSTMLHADGIGFVTCCAEFSLRISGPPNRRWHRLYGFILTELIVAVFSFHFKMA